MHLRITLGITFFTLSLSPKSVNKNIYNCFYIYILDFFIYIIFIDIKIVYI
jgi:hypothetical protein